MESGTSITSNKFRKTLWTEDESNVYDWISGNVKNSLRFVFGSVGGGENTAPIITPPNGITANMTLTIDTTTYINYTFTGSDSDGDDITFTALSKPDWISITTDPLNNSCTIFGQPTSQESGLNTITIEASDGGATDEFTFNILVTVPNLLIYEVGDVSSNWGNIAGKSYTYDDGARYIIIKNTTSMNINMENYKLVFYDTSINRINQQNDGGLTWVQGTGDYINNEYAYNSVQLKQVHHDASAILLNAKLATINDGNEENIILNSSDIMTAIGINNAWLGLYNLTNSTTFEIKNKIQELAGGRKDYKIDCIAAEFKDWEVSW